MNTRRILLYSLVFCLKRSFSQQGTPPGRLDGVAPVGDAAMAKVTAPLRALCALCAHRCAMLLLFLLLQKGKGKGKGKGKKGKGKKAAGKRSFNGNRCESGPVVGSAVWCVCAPQPMTSIRSHPSFSSSKRRAKSSRWSTSLVRRPPRLSSRPVAPPADGALSLSRALSLFSLLRSQCCARMPLHAPSRRGTRRSIRTST